MYTSIKANRSNPLAYNRKTITLGTGDGGNAFPSLQFTSRGGQRDVEQVVRQLGRIGAQADFLSNFQALMASGRYSPKAMHRLATILSVSASKYRDNALYELCHLLIMLDRIGVDEQARLELFLGLEKVTGTNIKDVLLCDQANWPEGQCHVKEDRYLVMVLEGDQTFQISFGRMVILIGLHEFLSAMDDFSFYAEFMDMQNRVVEAGPSCVPEMVSQISARLRRYRQTHALWAQYEERFDRLAPWLDREADARKDGHEGRTLVQRDLWQLDDAAVLSFWLDENRQERSRLFKTVLETFVDLLSVLKELHLASEMGSAGELVESQQAYVYVEVDEVWVSPLEDFDHAPLSDVKFFVKTNEYQPLQSIMKLGPDGLMFPLSLLRSESFSPVQNRVVQERRVKGSVRQDEMWTVYSYVELISRYETLAHHVDQLQLACAAALGLLSEDDQRGKKVFRSLRRKGFEEMPQGQARDVFRMAAERLPDISTFLIKAMNVLPNCLEQANFDEDRDLFFEQFRNSTDQEERVN